MAIAIDADSSPQPRNTATTDQVPIQRDRPDLGVAACPVPAVTPDLASLAGPLDPRFPLEQEGTTVVLFEGAPGELRAHWSLRANDAVSAAAGFPAAGGRPTPVLRLRRLGADGASDLVQEVPLRRDGLGGEGETTFAVGQDYAGFDAELGLINQDGGWLALTRSNRLQRAASIGLDLSRIKGAAGRPIRAVAVAGSALSPLVASAMPVGSPGSADAFVDSAAGDDPGPSLTLADAWGGTETSATTQIPWLVYGCPASPDSGPVIEAELRVSGRAAPNSEIDLFGHRYRVGPGGRFQLVIRVDDPVLLRQALALHPPPELSCLRED